MLKQGISVVVQVGVIANLYIVCREGKRLHPHDEQDEEQLLK